MFLTLISSSLIREGGVMEDKVYEWVEEDEDSCSLSLDGRG